MILGIGVDLLSLTRLRGVMARRAGDKLAARILCAEERVEWDLLGSRGAAAVGLQEQYLATR